MNKKMKEKMINKIQFQIKKIKIKILNKIIDKQILFTNFIFFSNGDWGLGIGDWGLGIGDWVNILFLIFLI